MKPKSFNPEATLELIADAFARGGYEGTSLDDIIKKTGLGKQSLYNTYGDKKAMLKKSLGCHGLKSEAATKLKNCDASGRRRIEGFFEAVLSECGDQAGTGCLVTNLLLEKGGSDAEVKKAATARWNQTRQGLEAVIELGKKDKSIRANVDAEIVSYALMNLLNGLRVTARATNDCAKMKKVVQTSLDSLL